MEENIVKKKKSIKIINIIFWVVLTLVALYAVLALTSTDDGTTSIFGRSAFTVQTNSMAPTFEKGDLVYVNTDFDVDNIKVGDVITYQLYIDITGDGEPEWIYNSHRVVSIEEDVNGYLHFVTKGDNNPVNDEMTVHQSYVIGVWTGDKVKHLGGIIDSVVHFLKSGTGFFIFIVLPSFAFLAYEVYKFIDVVAEYKKQQALGDRVKLQEEAVALAKLQLQEEARLQTLEKEKEKEKQKE